jgi:hypothetical protein
MTMMMPIVQFSLLDDFVEELRWGRCECVRVWPATWQRGQGHVPRGCGGGCVPGGAG